MNTMTEAARIRRDRPPQDDALRGVRRDARRQWREGRVRHRRLGLHGRARPVSARRHPVHLGRARTGRRPHGRRLRARVGPAWRVHRAERPGHHQFRDLDRGRVLGAFAGRGASRRRRAAPRSDSAASRRPSSCRSSRRSRSTRGTSTTRRAWPSSPARAFDRARLEMGPTQLNIPRDYFYGDIECEIPRPLTIERGAGGEKSLDEAAALLASAQFPVILAGGGVDHGRRRRPKRSRSPSCCRRRCARATCTTTRFRRAIRLWCGPLGYQGSKAAMKIIAKADVVLALGTRLGPFGTLPQHGIDYWPKNAKIIQIDADAKMLGPREADHRRHLRRREGRGARAVGAACPASALACASTTSRRGSRRSTARRRAWESELDGWTHEKDAWSLEVAKDSACDAPAPDAARARARDARQARWCPPTSATSARCPTPTCASIARARCSPR